MKIVYHSDDFAIRFEVGKTGNGWLWFDFKERYSGNVLSISMDELQWTEFKKIVDSVDYSEILPNQLIPSPTELMDRGMDSEEED